MGENLMQLMQTVKVIDVIFTMIVMIIVIGFLCTQWSKIKIWLERWKEKQNFEEKTNYSIGQLYQHDKEITNQISNIINNLNRLEQTVNGTKQLLQQKIEQDNETTRSKLKNDIEKIYMLHKDNKEITTYQFESLKDLITSYENHGGENSFVHSVVMKEMYKWKVIDLRNEINENLTTELE